MNELSAADKNELRRQKILAKRKARMAYAAGDRTTLPSTASAEPVHPPSEPAAAAKTADNAEEARPAPQPQPQSRHDEASPARPTTAIPASAATSQYQQPYCQQQQQPQSMPPYPNLPLDSLRDLLLNPSASAAPPAPPYGRPPTAAATAPSAMIGARVATAATSPRVRIAVFLLAGLLFALAAVSSVSTVEAFCLLQVALALPLVPGWLRSRRHRAAFAPAEPGGGLLGLVDFVTRASKTFVVANRVFGEFCVYLVTFLATIEALERFAPP